MIPKEECKKYLGGLNLPDEKIEEIRDELYVILENALDNYVKSGMLCPVRLIKKLRQGIKREK